MILNRLSNICSFFMVINLFISCNKKSDYPIKFDFEKTNKSYFISNNNRQIRINNSWTKEYSKSGKNCAKIFEKNPFGLSYTLKNLKKAIMIVDNFIQPLFLLGKI